MLVEPEADDHRLALDRAVANAVAARIAAGPRSGPDADAIALRALLPAVPAPARAAVLAAWGRTEPAPVACGPLAGLLAADRWGLSGGRVAEPEAALKTAADGGRALIDLSGVKAWWGRLLARPDVKVIAALPDDAAAMPQALLVARAVPGPTGDDRTFWVTDSPLPDAAIAQALGLSGLAATPLAAAGGLKLFLLAGYVQPEDGRLSGAPGTLTGVIGAAPQFRKTP